MNLEISRPRKDQFNQSQPVFAPSKSSQGMFRVLLLSTQFQLIIFVLRHYTGSSTCPIFGRYQLSSSTTNNVVDHCQPPPCSSSLSSPSHFLPKASNFACKPSLYHYLKLNNIFYSIMFGMASMITAMLYAIPLAKGPRQPSEWGKWDTRGYRKQGETLEKGDP
jgi:hypothetical protein